MATLTILSSGCVSAPVTDGDAYRLALDPLVNRHVDALAGCDINLMRSTGRDLVATYDALAFVPGCP